MADAKRRTGQELSMALASTKQNLTLLRSQVRNNRIDPDYLEARLASMMELVEDIEADRVGTLQQKRVAVLYEVSKVIGSSLNLQTVLDQVMDAIIQLSGAERGFLMLLDDDGNLKVKVARNFDQETLESKDFAVSQTITRQVFEKGEPVVTTNALEDPRYAGQASIITHGMRSIIATPLRARGQITGVVYVDNRIRAGIFSEEDLGTLDTFASQAAVAIDNARLYSETDAELQERLEELRILQWIDRQLNESLDMAKSLNITVEWATRLTKADSGVIGLINPERNVVEVKASFGVEADATKVFEYPLDSPLLKESTESDNPVVKVVNESTILCLPIRFTGDVIGYLILNAKRANAFDEDAQDLVMRMAERSASAIQNARLYSQVAAANRAKSEFVSLVAHELKVPMTSIRGYASMVEMTGGISDRQKGFIRIIENNVDRMRVMVEDLNDISRIESGQLKVDLEDVNLSELLTQAKEGVMTQIQDRGHTLVEDFDAEFPTVKSNKVRLVQVLVNLLSNAYKYTPNNGIITFAAKREGDRVRLSVTDNGIGMTEEQVRMLGTKFFRADHEHVHQQSGTGLGFAITRNLIELMGSDLKVESSLGKGSTFTFWLNVAE